MGRACVPSLFFDLRPNYSGGNEDNGDLFKRSHACTATFSAPNSAAGRHQPTSLPETPGHPRASLGSSLVGSLLLSPGSWSAQGFVCALQESVSPVLWTFCQLYVGVKGDLLQEGLCHTQVCCTQWPCPFCRPLLTRIFAEDTQAQFWLSLWVLVCTRFVWALSPSLATPVFLPGDLILGGLILKAILPLLPSFWGFSFALGCELSFFGGIQYSSVDGHSAASCSFGVLWLDKWLSFELCRACR